MSLAARQVDELCLILRERSPGEVLAWLAQHPQARHALLLRELADALYASGAQVVWVGDAVLAGDGVAVVSSLLVEMPDDLPRREAVVQSYLRLAERLNNVTDPTRYIGQTFIDFSTVLPEEGP
jgi:hypothetical protein